MRTKDLRRLRAGTGERASERASGRARVGSGDQGMRGEGGWLKATPTSAIVDKQQATAVELRSVRPQTILELSRFQQTWMSDIDIR